MSQFIFDTVTVPSLPIIGEDTYQFPIRRIYCVGQNYRAHAAEMGTDPQKTVPFFFDKPNDCATTARQVAYPPQTTDLHHEVELVVALGKGGRNLTKDQAIDAIYGYGVGFDLTRRDLQAIAKKSGKPWDLSKGFDQSAPISALRKASDIGHPHHGKISCHVNGKPRQSGDLSDMIWSVPEQIMLLSKTITLKPGDLLFTGTPEGVSAIAIGDELYGSIEGVGDHTIHIVDEL